MADQARPASRASQQPNSWLRELVRLKPAVWPWGHAIRSGLCVALPWAIGLSVDSVITAMWVSLGAMMASTAEPAGSYRAKLRQIIVVTAIGAFGFFAGHLAALPWSLVVLVMGGAGILAGIVSSWGAKFSIGSMQFFLIASIAIGVPGDLSFWKPAALFAAGAAFYAALLAIEGRFESRRTERALIARLAASLGHLSSIRAAGIPYRSDATVPSDAEVARRLVTDALSALGAYALELRSQARGRDTEAEAISAILARGDNTFAEILACDDSAALSDAGTKLQDAAKVIGRGELPQHAGADDRGSLARAVQAFLLAAGPGGSSSVFQGYGSTLQQAGLRARGIDLHLLWGRLTPGSAVQRGALALGLCLALAYSVRWFTDNPHWFWVPLTVGLVMKPDLGSVFARAVLRSAGTIGGAAIGAAILALHLEGGVLAAVIGLLAATLPWAMRPSYAVQAVVLTPLVLILVNTVEPGSTGLALADVRVIDTVIGSAIVLVFGYFIWPRSRAPELAAGFRSAKADIAAYLAAAGTQSDDLVRCRRKAYGSLSNLRARLQGLLVEPPPASREAIAWFPLIAGAERICDRITAFSVGGAVSETDQASLQAAGKYIASTPDERKRLPPLAYHGDDERVMSLVTGIRGELSHMARLQEGGTFPSAPVSE